MTIKFTQQAQRAIQLAHEEARSLNHGYVGTEHLLLGLLREETGIAGEVLKRFGVDSARVRAEVEKQVLRGPEGSCTSGEVPLTPRAKHAIDYAIDDVRFMKQPMVDTDHLLVGLIHEPEGVAGRVLRSFGLELKELQREVFTLRLLQYTIVERVVRAVRASAAHKRKMREELLAHLEGIYEDEYACLHDSSAALKAAAQRFGDPAELSGELNRSLPAYERRAYYFERWLGWLAPESAARYLRRLSAVIFVAIGGVCVFGMVAGALITGTFEIGWRDLCGVAAFVLTMSLTQFLFGILYFRMRDALWGAFGRRKSPSTVLGCALLISVVGFAAVSIFTAVANWDITEAVRQSYVGAIMGLGSAIAYFINARVRGRTEISDAHWELLDIEKAQLA
ncbi:MAG TPA: Clp protease N-terminal domain-containing protein [Tepidisphaeraceae bacterium]